MNVLHVAWMHAAKILDKIRKIQGFILCYFLPTYMGEENHDLCCVFFQILPNLLPDSPDSELLDYLSYLNILVT